MIVNMHNLGMIVNLVNCKLYGVIPSGFSNVLLSENLGHFKIKSCQFCFLFFVSDLMTFLAPYRFCMYVVKTHVEALCRA